MRLFVVSLTYQRVMDNQNFTWLGAAETAEAALGLAIACGDAMFPGHDIAASKAVSDVTDAARLFVLAHPPGGAGNE